jgi:chromosome segregation protein
LKRVEIVGFKSFADKTVLNFERGMTAIVGPNGCGKSNTSDAIRWVLGEQNARNLRGGTMQDVIFSGTDSHKPLNMAEVNLTLAECEGVLNTEYSEVTITRRVFRSGDSHYLVNKTPCRLKDIQRLFMDTGIGRGSYSIMEQGKIDQILSSRPEDRRAVFEEASGITKFRNDKREALRKLEQTEANLLRLDDIIREVKRQIISLQRQAGKARRYQQLMQELRAYDVYVSRLRLGELDRQIEQTANQVSSVSEQLEAHREDIAGLEQEAGERRTRLEQLDQEIARAVETVSRLRNQMEATRNLIQINEDRVRELQEVAARDTRDADEARARLAEHQENHAALTGRHAEAVEKLAVAERDLAEKQARHQELERLAQAARLELHQARQKSLELENRAVKLQNELQEMDARRQATVLRKERLAAEQIGLTQAGEVHAQRQEAARQRLAQAQAQGTEKSTFLNELVSAKGDQARRLSEGRQQLNQLQQKAAGLRARLEMLSARQAREEGFPGGARLLMDAKEEVPGLDRGRILGVLAEMVVADPEYQTALESVLRNWLDAVVVRDSESACAILRVLGERKAGAARLLTVEELPAYERPDIGVALLPHVRVAPEALPLVNRLLATASVVDSFDDLPLPLPLEAVLVRRDGALLRGDGAAEFWMVEGKATNPLAKMALRTQTQEELERLDGEIAAAQRLLEALHGEEQSLEQRIAAAREAVNASRQEVGQAEGELRTVSREQQQAADRLRTVTAELDALLKQEAAADQRHAGLAQSLEQARGEVTTHRERLAELSRRQEEVEQQRLQAANELAERRLAAGEARQETANLDRQRTAARDRIAELGQIIEERSRGVTTYRQRVEELQRQAEAARESIAPLESARAEAEQELAGVRTRRQTDQQALSETDAALRQRRGAAEALAENRNKLDIRLAEGRLNRQNLLERVLGEHRIEVDKLAEEPDPVWENGEVPPLETVETHLAELRAKIESIGPVNLVAIEEHQELEDRHQFLTRQQSDLVEAKTQLVDMLKKINLTTTELFTDTFNKVNENFEKMFTKLFGGGSAKLVLVNEDDVLESGIEIIARPPGKKLQNISLLSGGERTMTAVALLFALFLVKPSPFCVLDEMDAALDEANIGRFVEAVKEFVRSSQFIVITHNQKTMAAADVLYGVTMEQKGVSKLVSLKFAGDRPRPDTVPDPAEGEFAAAR